MQKDLTKKEEKQFIKLQNINIHRNVQNGSNMSSGPEDEKYIGLYWTCAFLCNSFSELVALQQK